MEHKLLPSVGKRTDKRSGGGHSAKASRAGADRLPQKPIEQKLIIFPSILRKKLLTKELQCDIILISLRYIDILKLSSEILENKI